MKAQANRVRTRSPFPMTVNTRVTREMQLRCQAAARELGVIPSDVYRAAFDWWLKCYEAAGARKLSDLEERAALDSIRSVSSRLHETAAHYTANAPAAIPSKRNHGAA
jgi:hypothetical protein